MLKRLLNGKSNTIASAAVIVAGFSLLSRFVGFIRDRILAGQFGASDELDIYFQAFRIPDLFYQLVVIGALSASFIPLFTKYYKKKKKEDAWFLTSNILNITTVAFIFLSILAAIAAPLLAQVVAPGFDVEKQRAVADLTRIMLISQVFLTMSMVFGSALQGAKRFVLYSLAPIFYNVGIITGAVVFVPYLGIQGLAWGVVFGGFMHFLIQLIGILTLGFRYTFSFQFKHPDVVYTLKHMPPRVMGLAVNQVNFLAMTMIASFLMDGSVTMLQFAYNLNFFPIGVFAISYAIAAFPTMCEQAGENEKNQFVQTFSTTVRQILLFIIPSTVGFIFLRAQIVRLVVGAGKFSWESTILTADMLGWFAASLIAQSIVFILIRAYFAKSDTLTPFVVGLVSATVNIIAALFFTTYFSVTGLGMAYSISAVMQMLLLWVPLHVRLGGLDEKRIIGSLFKLGLAGAACGLAIQGMEIIVVRFITLDTFVGVLSQGLIAGGIGIAVYITVAFLLRSREMLEFIQGMKRRLFKRAKPEEQIVTTLT